MALTTLPDVPVAAETCTRKRIVLCRDESGLSRRLSEILEREGFNCHVSTDASEALQLSGRGSFDAVIMELDNPATGTSGVKARADAEPTERALTAAQTNTGPTEEADNGGIGQQLRPSREGLRTAARKRRSEASGHRRISQGRPIIELRGDRVHGAIEWERGIYREILEALGAALDVRDSDTAGHTTRVSRYSLEIAKVLGCSEAEMDDIARGASVHDIGKIGIPDAILLKEGKLTPEETAVMQAHVDIGYEIVSRIACMASAANVVLAHHERWDGSGYPRGLEGERIPRGARIFALADALDAITSDRPYRQAAPFDAARAEIIRESGHQFDPQVVEAFLSLPQEVWENIRKGVSDERGAQKRDMPKLIMVWHRRNAR